jgi:hypothetical protein
MNGANPPNDHHRNPIAYRNEHSATDEQRCKQKLRSLKPATRSYVAPISSHLEFRHRHLGSNRVGNETIFMGGMVHFVELFCTGFLVATPLNPWV